MEIEEKLRNIKIDGKGNLSEHLLNVMSLIVETNPSNPLARFEELSQHVKDTGYNFASKVLHGGSADGRRDHNQGPQLLKAAKYFGFHKEQVEDGAADDQGDKESAPIGFVSDLVADDRIFRRAGLGFGETESYKIFVALKVGTSLDP